MARPEAPATLPEPSLPNSRPPPPPTPLLSLDPPALWAGIWFVGFCFLANQWQHSLPRQFLLGSSSVKAAITFAFFSILVWVRSLLPAGRGGVS